MSPAMPEPTTQTSAARWSRIGENFGISTVDIQRDSDAAFIIMSRSAGSVAFPFEVPHARRSRRSRSSSVGSGMALEILGESRRGSFEKKDRGRNKKYPAWAGRNSHSHAG
jgi:hypothetical protein